jgi:glutathione S-transferase
LRLRPKMPPLAMAEALPVLYSFRRCPYAMRARLALHASGLAVEHREIELKNKPARMLAASPKGTVPVMVLPDGTVIDESLDIMRWALQSRDPLHWWPNDLAQLSAAMVWIEENDGAFKKALDRYKYPHRFGLADGNAGRDAGCGLLHRLEALLDKQPYMAGEHQGLCDAALAPFVRQFAHCDKAWFAAQAWPHVVRWLADFEASAAYAAIMHKHSLWVDASLPA